LIFPKTIFSAFDPDIIAKDIAENLEEIILQGCSYTI
jgi:hypothetical protein